MIMKKEYLEDVREKIENMPPSIFENLGLKKPDILADSETMERLWTIYQKNVEDYDCEPHFAARDAVREVLGAPCDNPLVFETYALEIRTGTGRSWKEVGSLQELETEISRYLTESEKKEVLPKLIYFTPAMVDEANDYAKNCWRNFATYAYPV